MTALTFVENVWTKTVQLFRAKVGWRWAMVNLILAEQSN